jgi:hypothetical protein
MPTFYIDETGFTGEDLLAIDQPIFVQATTNYDAAETEELIYRFFGGVKADELKHGALSRKPAHQQRVIDLVQFVANDPNRVSTWIAHKEYAAVTFIVEWWLEPLAHASGLNLYKDGANHGLANVLFVCLQGFWSDKFRKKILLAFQRMFRARTQERFDECYELISRLRDEFALDDRRSEILRYLWPSFELLGLEHVQELPDRVLDLALPGLIRLMHSWRGRHEGPWEVVHDRSSNMAKQKWLWDKLSAPDLGQAVFEGPHGPGIFPMNVVSTRFVDSKAEKQIQLCDVLAGATSSSLRLPEENPYRTGLIEAGIHNLIIDSIWPSTDVTPDALGKKGWDGNIAIEWISEAMAKKDIKAAAKAT